MSEPRLIDVLSADSIRVLLAGERIIAFNTAFARISGSVTAGLFLSQLLYWTPRGNDPDGWIYKTRAEWMEETFLTRRELDAARKFWAETGVIEETQDRGSDRTTSYRVNFAALSDVLHLQNPAGPSTRSGHLEKHKPVTSKTPNRSLLQYREYDRDYSTDTGDDGAAAPVHALETPVEDYKHGAPFTNYGVPTGREMTDLEKYRARWDEQNRKRDGGPDPEPTPTEGAADASKAMPAAPRGWGTDVRVVFGEYAAKIQPKARLLPNGAKKIAARLKVYTVEELTVAIHNFAGDAWQMEHNAHQGVAWWFASDDRIERYKNMVPRNAEKTVAQRMDGEFNAMTEERRAEYRRLEAQIEARSRGLAEER